MLALLELFWSSLRTPRDNGNISLQHTFGKEIVQIQLGVGRISIDTVGSIQ